MNTLFKPRGLDEQETLVSRRITRTPSRRHIICLETIRSNVFIKRLVDLFIALHYFGVIRTFVVTYLKMNFKNVQTRYVTL